MTFSSGQSHHRMSSSASMTSGSNRNRRTFAGFPATIAYGGTLRATTACAPTTAPSPIVTPLRTLAPPAIHTSLPTVWGPWSKGARRCSLPEARNDVETGRWIPSPGDGYLLEGTPHPSRSSNTSPPQPSALAQASERRPVCHKSGRPSRASRSRRGPAAGRLTALVSPVAVEARTSSPPIVTLRGEDGRGSHERRIWTKSSRLRTWEPLLESGEAQCLPIELVVESEMLRSADSLKASGLDHRDPAADLKG